MDTAHAPPDAAQKTASATQALHDDIRTRWNRFSDFEVGSLRDAEDLVAKVAAKYDLEASKARSDVTALLKGRRV